MVKLKNDYIAVVYGTNHYYGGDFEDAIVGFEKNKGLDSKFIRGDKKTLEEFTKAANHLYFNDDRGFHSPIGRE